MKPIIELKKVNKVYQMGTTPVHALRDVNLKINKKELVSVIGPSGSGKSTLLHIMGCLDRPTSGKVFLNGYDISKLNDDQLAELRRKNIGFIFQFFNLYPTLTAKENIELPMIVAELDNKEKERNVFKLLKMVGLEDRADHLPSQLSGGESQRVAIARALANNPNIILADEPTGNLDTKSGKEIIDILINLNKKYGVTVVIITHESQIASKTKRNIYLRDGKIIKEKK
ncbi:MAG: ABC transporter ATP-binding protein [Candidatus Aenigmatarchaeota archaeon]